MSVRKVETVEYRTIAPFHYFVVYVEDEGVGEIACNGDPETSKNWVAWVDGVRVEARSRAEAIRKLTTPTE